VWRILRGTVRLEPESQAWLGCAAMAL